MATAAAATKAATPARPAAQQPAISDPRDFAEVRKVQSRLDELTAELAQVNTADAEGIRALSREGSEDFRFLARLKFGTGMTPAAADSTFTAADLERLRKRKRVLEEALKVGKDALRVAERNAGAAVCKGLAGQHRANVEQLAAALVAAGQAQVRHDALLNALHAVGITTDNPHVSPCGFRSVDGFGDPTSQLGCWIQSAIDAGFLDSASPVLAPWHSAVKTHYAREEAESHRQAEARRRRQEAQEQRAAARKAKGESAVARTFKRLFG